MATGFCFKRNRHTRNIVEYYFNHTKTKAAKSIYNLAKNMKTYSSGTGTRKMLPPRGRLHRPVRYISIKCPITEEPPQNL